MRHSVYMLKGGSLPATMVLNELSKLSAQIISCLAFSYVICGSASHSKGRGQRFLFRVQPLAMCKGELSAVIA